MCTWELPCKDEISENYVPSKTIIYPPCTSYGNTACRTVWQTPLLPLFGEGVRHNMSYRIDVRKFFLCSKTLPQGCANKWLFEMWVIAALTGCSW